MKTTPLASIGGTMLFASCCLVKWEVVPAPNVNWDMLYQPGKGRDRIVRIHDIDRDGTFALLYRRLATMQGEKPERRPSNKEK